MIAVVAMVSLAMAFEIPANADVIVTDDQGVIVGVGWVADGARFELRLLVDFAGPARLIWLSPDGAVETVDVVVGDGVVTVDGVDLRELLPRGFVDVAFRFERVLDAGPNPPADAGRGNGRGRGPPDGVPGDRSENGRGPDDAPPRGRPPETPPSVGPQGKPDLPEVPGRGTPGGDRR